MKNITTLVTASYAMLSITSMTRDCNPGLEFSIPGFGIVEFPIPGSRRDWRSIVNTTKIATWVTVFGSLFLNYKCVRSCYGFIADVL